MKEITSLPTCLLCGKKFEHRADDNTMGYCGCGFVLDYYDTLCPICLGEQYILTYTTGYRYKRILICQNIKCPSSNITLDKCLNYKKFCNPRRTECNGNIIKFREFSLTTNLGHVIEYNGHCYNNFKLELKDEILKIIKSKLNSNE